MAPQAAGKKTSCSELKKLQIIKRRKNSNNNAGVQSITPLSMAALSTSNFVSEGENDCTISNANPFAKKVKTIVESAPSSKCGTGLVNFSSSEPKNNLFNDDFLNDLTLSNTFTSKTMNIFQEHHSTDSDQPSSSYPNNRNLIVEKSLKTSVIFEVDKPLTEFHTALTSPSYILDSMTDPCNNNLILYYRYPETVLPQQQRKLIHKALKHHKEATPSSKASTGKEDPNLIWYREFSENWRKALLSAFETLKYEKIRNFYYVQENLTILFERCHKSHSLKAILKLSSMALAEDLKSNGIEYKILSSSSSGTEKITITEMPVKEHHDDDTDDEAENEESGSIDPRISISLKPLKVRFEKQDILIEGSIALAELVDFLLNQKDRHSYAILPEIYSPGPFIYGTLRRNQITIAGPCRSSNSNDPIYQLKIDGFIFPGPISNFIRDLRFQEMEVNVLVEREINTDFLSSYLQEH